MAGQSCCFDQVVWLILAGPCDGVGKHDAALGVGVEDFRGDATVVSDDITRADRVAGWHVFCQRNRGGQLHVDIKFRGGDGGSNNGSRAAHIHDHVAHASSWLERDTAGIKGNTLTNQRDFLLRFAWAVV